MAIVSVGIDLARNAFAAPGVDQAGKPVLVRSRVPRAKLLEPIAGLPPCFIGTEACYGAQEYPIDWGARTPEVRPLLRLMAPKFVIPHHLSEIAI